ncbi:hypothetical protein C8Q77DRAFT_372685 [Trametes polyzona]|nr:hypothetical protein C8Q77DRAFT_372685 [Trametes polyzona]
MTNYSCARCPSKTFRREKRLIEHKALFHPSCRPCKETFTSHWELTQHYIRSRRHPYCQRCRIHFEGRRALREHFSKTHHFCGDCNTVRSRYHWLEGRVLIRISQIFEFEIGLHEHRRKVHIRRYCATCKHMFKDRDALNNHRRTPGEGIRCPMHVEGCCRSFVTLTELVPHLGSGECVARLSPKVVDRLVAQASRSHIGTAAKGVTAGVRVPLADASYASLQQQNCAVGCP